MQPHPKPNTLVEQEFPELEKGPAIASAAFSFGARQLVCSLSDTCQVFNGDRPVSSLSPLDQPIADGVVLVSLKSSFPSTQPSLELPTSSTATSRALGRLLLQRGSHLAELVSNLRYLFATKFLSFRSYNNIDPAQINS